MDGKDDSLFATGSSGPESNAESGGGKPTGTGDGIEGRIDPAIARATAGIEAAGAGDNLFGGGSSDTATGPAGPEQAVRRGPGRPRGPSSGTAQADKTRNIRPSFIEKTLQLVHITLVATLNAPEFQLEDDDAKLVAEAGANWLAFHKVKMTPRQEANLLLLEALGQVYPPMLFNVYMRKQREWKERQKAAPPKPTPARPQAPPAAAPGFASERFDPFKIQLPKSD